MAWVLSSFTNRVLSKLDFVIWCSLLCVKRPVDFTLYACVCVCLKFPCVFTYHVNRELMDFVNIIFCALVIFAKRGWRSYHRLIFCIFGMMICVACSLVAEHGYRGQYLLKRGHKFTKHREEKIWKLLFCVWN